METLDFAKLLGAGGLAGASAIAPPIALLGAVPEVAKLIGGIGQRIQANKIGKRTQRPMYEIPQSAIDALATQQNLAMGNAPGLSTAQNQLAQSQAGSISAIQGSGGGQAETMAALALLDQNAGTAAQNLGAMQEDWKAGQYANLINEKNRMAQWEQQQFLYDKDEPYRNAMEKMSQLREEGNQNMYDAGKSLGGLAASTITSDGDGEGTMGEAASRLAGSAGSRIGTRQGESPTDNTAMNRSIDLDNMGPQGEGPINPNGLDRLSPAAPVDDGTLPMDETPMGGRQYNPGSEGILGTIWDYKMGNRINGRPDDKLLGVVAKRLGGIR